MFDNDDRKPYYNNKKHDISELNSKRKNPFFKIAIAIFIVVFVSSATLFLSLNSSFFNMEKTNQVENPKERFEELDNFSLADDIKDENMKYYSDFIYGFVKGALLEKDVEKLEKWFDDRSIWFYDEYYKGNTDKRVFYPYDKIDSFRLIYSEKTEKNEQYYYMSWSVLGKDNKKIDVQINVEINDGKIYRIGRHYINSY